MKDMYTEQQKQEARQMIEEYFGHLDQDKQDELYESLLDQDYDEWEDWCINMSLDYEATDMMHSLGY